MIEESTNLTVAENIAFWFVWVLMIILGLIIFLNFVIAEVTKSYNTIDAHIEPTKSREKALLCIEAEQWMPDAVKAKPQNFPKFIVFRKVD